MKLAAIFCAWSDCTDLLEKSVDNILPVVDDVIIVWSHTSHRGEFVPFRLWQMSPKVNFIQCEPVLGQGWIPQRNEIHRRNVGLDYARAIGCTHFLTMDGDEFYHQADVEMEKKRMELENLNGLVCGLRVYVKEPTLWCEDHTIVPFIQKLTPEVSLGDYQHYPFTYDKDHQCHIDPTRRPSHRTRVEWSDVIMHHFSYVRKDIELKIRNSSANLVRSRDVILRELEQAAPGRESLLYHRTLKECEDVFKIKGAESVKDPAPR